MKIIDAHLHFLPGEPGYCSEIAAAAGHENQEEALRREYADAVLGSLRRHLDNTYVVDHKGNKTKLKRKEGKE